MLHFFYSYQRKFIVNSRHHKKFCFVLQLPAKGSCCNWVHACRVSPSSRAQIYKRSRSPEIDSKESIPPTGVALRADTKTLFVVPASQNSIPRNRFLGSLNVPVRQESIPWNQCLGSLNVHKFVLCTLWEKRQLFRRRNYRCTACL